MEERIDEEKARAELEKGYDEAKKLLEDEDKVELFLQKLEKKLRDLPVAGGKLSYIPVMASLVRSYIKKEYTNIPIGTIIAIVSTLIYFVSPIDLFPDGIPFLGYVDDAAVIAVCWGLVNSDVKEYIKWRSDNNRVLDL